MKVLSRGSLSKSILQQPIGLSKIDSVKYITSQVPDIASNSKRLLLAFEKYFLILMS